MIEYAEVEDVAQIRRLNRSLSTVFRRALSQRETRTIGYPQGTFEAEVRFRSNRGEDVFWWGGKLSDNEERALNFVGRGTPGDGTALNIDVQFTVPVVEFSRRYGGTFLRQLVTGTFVLAHRGIVTLGHGRVRKAALFSEMAATLREASSGQGTAEFLLIGEMESPTLVDEEN